MIKRTQKKKKKKQKAAKKKLIIIIINNNNIKLFFTAVYAVVFRLNFYYLTHFLQKFEHSKWVASYLIQTC